MRFNWLALFSLAFVLLTAPIVSHQVVHAERDQSRSQSSNVSVGAGLPYILTATSMPTTNPSRVSGSVNASGFLSQETTVGPDNFPAGVNPLTGLPVRKPRNLDLPPALVSITNFPVTARPQAGLSYSPFVFEVYIGEGTTRFLAMFYGDFPSQDDQAANKPSDAAVTVDYTVGPVRSGRLTYEPIRKQYGGFLVMASAWSGVAANLKRVYQCVWHGCRRYQQCHDQSDRS